MKAKGGISSSGLARKKNTKFRGSKSVPTLDLEYGKAVLREITGGVHTIWRRSKSFQSSQLTSKYAILERLALYNWVSSNHRTGVLKSMFVLLYKLGKGVSFDLGALIFHQISRHVETTSINLDFGYPFLIFGILTSQNGVLVHEGELCKKDTMKMFISKKFFQGQHIQDIQ